MGQTEDQQRCRYISTSLKLVYYRPSSALECSNVCLPLCVVQVILHSDQSPTDLRSVTAEHMNRLTKIPGIIIGCHSVQSKAHTVNAQCRSSFPDVSCHPHFCYTLHSCCVSINCILKLLTNRRCQAVRRFNCEGQFGEARVELPKEVRTIHLSKFYMKLLASERPVILILFSAPLEDQSAAASRLQCYWMSAPSPINRASNFRRVQVIIARDTYFFLLMLLFTYVVQVA